MEMAISIISLDVSVITGGFALYSFFWTASRDRKQATLDAYNNLQKQALDHLNHYMPKAIEDIALHPRSTNTKRSVPTWRELSISALASTAGSTIVRWCMIWRMDTWTEPSKTESNP